MKSKYGMSAALAGLIMLLAACGPAATSTTAPETTMPEVTSAPEATTAPEITSAPQATSAPSSTQAAPTGPATIDLGKNDKLGEILVDDKGMSLYLYTKDTPNTSACYGKCATAWPPLLTSGAPAAGTGVDAAKLGTTKRTDGSEQVTYNGWPLYYYAKDMNPGDITGEDVGQVWFLVSASGEQVMSATLPTAILTTGAAASGSASGMVWKNDFLVSFWK